MPPKGGPAAGAPTVPATPARPLRSTGRITVDMSVYPEEPKTTRKKSDEKSASISADQPTTTAAAVTTATTTTTTTNQPVNQPLQDPFAFQAPHIPQPPQASSNNQPSSTSQTDINPFFSIPAVLIAHTAVTGNSGASQQAPQNPAAATNAESTISMTTQHSGSPAPDAETSNHSGSRASKRSSRSTDTTNKPKRGVSDVIPPPLIPTYGHPALGGSRTSSTQSGSSSGEPLGTHDPEIRRSNTPSVARSSQNSGDGSRFKTPPTCGSSPEGSPSPDPGAQVAGPLVPPPPQSFWEVFKEQICAGIRHLKSWEGLFAIAIGTLLLCVQLCSAGRLCYDDEGVWRILKVWHIARPRPNRYLGSYISLLSANIMTILGLCDLALGLARIAQMVGKRVARRAANLAASFPQAIPQTAPQDIAHSYSRAMMRVILKVLLIISIPLVDLLNEVAEPCLMLFLMFGLKDLPMVWSPAFFGGTSNPVMLICISEILHLIKWCLQTVEILKGLSLKSALRHPLVLVFLSTLVPLVVLLHLDTILEARAIAGQYFFLGKWSVVAMAASWAARKKAGEAARSMGVSMVKVTHRVVTKWVEPTSVAHRPT